jgi:hypothetical protein
MHRITLPSTKHHFMFLEAGEIATAAHDGVKWMRHQNDLWKIDMKRFEKQIVLGEDSYVARAEAIMSEIEDLVPITRAWRNVDDVVGGLPNVPAFLAGTPQNMRRRVRTMSETAPLTIFMNLATSAIIDADTVLRRGIVLLALTRLLVEHRTVELWVGTTLDDGHHSGTAAWRIDTAPLDLARAAFMIADVSMSRLFGYAMCEVLTDCHLGGGGQREQHAARLREATGWHEDGLLYIPWMSVRDDMVNDPVGWIRERLAQYTSGSDSNSDSDD